MCGIFGCIIKDSNVAPVIHDALKRLAYRGYDSVGLATAHEGRILVKKDKGTIDEIHRRINLDDLAGTLGIGHTRWATHGAPSMENAHPHTDCSGRIAVVHNGIIENFMEVKRELEARGHTFRSRTDTEVIPHLIEEHIKNGENLKEALRKTVLKLRGSIAAAAIYAGEPDRIVCVRVESPLIIGVKDNGVYCASDIPAFLPYTNKTIIMEEGEMAELTFNKLQLMDIGTGELLKPKVVEVDWTAEIAEKGGYPHFMFKEIYEQPLSIRDALRTQQIYHDLVASKLNEADNVFLVACGTSYHACLVAAYLLRKIAGINSQALVASEFNDQMSCIIDSKTVVLAVSQSGETADTLNAVRNARKMGASIVSITNVMGSTITRLSDVYIGQNSGPEIGVAATKTFTAQLAVLTKLTLATAKLRGKATEDVKNLEDELLKASSYVKQIIEGCESNVKRIAGKYSGRKSFCFLGRGISVPTAMEARLKLLEIAYIPSLAYPAGEGKHGFIAMVEEGYPVVFVAPKDETHGKLIGNIMEMKARGANVISIIEEEDNEVKRLSDDYVEMPKQIPSTLTPLTYIVPLQLLAYYTAVERGCDPDHPRNLAKSVTVE